MSRYEVQALPAHGSTAYRLIDSVRRATALFYPAFGANCVEFQTTPDPEGRDAEGAACAPVALFVPPDPIETLWKSPAHGGQPLLFPFPNRVRDGVYTFEGKTHRMEKLLATGRDHGAGHAIHGLVGDKEWTVEQAHADESGATVRAYLQLDAFPDIFEQYPYPCRLTITYLLREGVLEMRAEAVN